MQERWGKVQVYLLQFQSHQNQVRVLDGIDLQQRDTGDAFSPFGPLQSTFTKDLSEVEGFDYLTPTQQMINTKLKHKIICLV